MRPAIKPLARLALTFAIVWFYHALLVPYLSGWPHVVAVVLLAVPTWIVLGRALFPADPDESLVRSPRDRE